ncbi:het-domain protein [Fusarium beomiforme]|uniref:Het-domain protein n=1 Tax=Fusarium beomiforme TaxID=44412 RepID=A0A9P5ABP6_9HYPO|nr:het-domain protein [Fusarium beomiforme]
MSLYQYLPLRDGEIRLTKLEDISCDPSDVTPAITIIKKQLKDAKGTYEALSYAWGNSNHRRPLPCGDGCYLWAGENLHSALRNLVRRRRQDPSLSSNWVWIDAICINQDDDVEKNRQVAMMRSIYRSSVGTVAYLGEEENDSRLAMGYIRGVKNKAAQAWIEWLRSTDVAAVVKAQYPAMEHDKEFIKEAIRMEESRSFNEILAELGSSDWKMFGALLPEKHRILRGIALLAARPYFQRTWVIQEMAVAQKTILYCGTDHCDLAFMAGLFGNTFRPAGIRLADYVDDATRTDLYRGVAQLLMAFSLSTKIRDGEHRSLFQLLQSSRAAQVTHAVDKVYALLGLCVDFEEFPVDYGKSKVDTYIDLAKQLIQHGQGDDLLYEAARSDHSSSECPSWVPDWTKMPIRTNLGCTLSSTAKWYCDASGVLKRRTQDYRNPPLRMKLLCRGKKLVTEGAIVQKILVLGSAPPPAEQVSATSNAAHLANILDDLSTFKDRLSKRVYPPTGQPIDTALATILEGDQPHNTIGLTNWNEEPSSRSILYEIDKHELQQQSGKRRYGFAEALHQRNFTAIENMAKATVGRRVAVTNKSFVALVPAGTQRGDQICILQGALVPFVLRPCGDGYILVGDCYVHGMMLGEMFSKEEKQPEMQEIIIK